VCTGHKGFHPRTACWPEPPSKPKYAPFVKICGIKTVKDAIVAVNAGADMLGLDFLPTSKHIISLETAQNISNTVRSRPSRSSSGSEIVPPHAEDDQTNSPWFATQAHHLASMPNSFKRPLLVGVFQNQSLAFILHTVMAVQLDIIQLNGFEPAEWAKQIPVPVIKTFHVHADGAGLEHIT
jgi:anthranilate synthase/indole-3-glycerol phosphate synthase/phosphoribosylanthranilate isomerase